MLNSIVVLGLKPSLEAVGPAVGADEEIGESGTNIETDSEGNKAKIEIEAEADLSMLGDLPNQVCSGPKIEVEGMVFSVGEEDVWHSRTKGASEGESWEVMMYKQVGRAIFGSAID
ncbi:hypothetical protein U1Q18_037611 [Sarracenia purpurea var. burkii]